MLKLMTATIPLPPEWQQHHGGGGPRGRQQRRAAPDGVHRASFRLF